MCNAGINLKINNMKKPVTLILTLLFGISAFAQTYTILVRPAGVKEWGYANLKGEMIISAQYKKCIGFSEDGLAAINDAKSKQFYFINVKGETLPTDVKDFKLQEFLGFGMKGFSNGFAPVKVGEKWGFLNTEGKLAIPANYDKVTQFNGGLTTGEKDKKFFVIDKSGAEYPADVPDLVDLNNFSEKMASFKTSGDLVGFLDGSGKVAIPAQFKAAGDFVGGLAWAKNNQDLVGYINPKGEWVIKPQFAAGKDFSPESGIARIKTADTWAFVNKAGEIIYKKDTDTYEDFSDGLSRGKKKDKFGYFNDKGVWAIEPQFDGARDFKNGYASVKKGELWGVIDKTGKWVIEPKFDEIKDVEASK
jgi:hypothetical protein